VKKQRPRYIAAVVDVSAVLDVVNRAFEIDERRGLDPTAFLRDWVARSRPIVLRGALEGSPALGWTPAALAALDAARPVPVTSYRTGNAHDMRDRVVAEMRIADYVAALRAPRPPGDPYPYLACGLDYRFPELATTAMVPVLPAGLGAKRVLTLGNGSISGAHFHSRAHALVIALSGRKIAVVHPPSESPRLYPNPVFHPFYCHSRARFDDARRFPLLRAARAAVVMLDPGDALFVPAWWWHNVLGLGETISLSCFWPARRLQQRLARPFVRNAIGRLLEPTLHRLLMRFEEPVRPLPGVLTARGHLRK